LLATPLGAGQCFLQPENIMTDRLSNIELLVLLSEDIAAEGDDLKREIFQREQAYSRRLREMRSLLNKANGLLARQEERFPEHIPETAPPKLPRTEMPRVVTKGPAQAS
jgi:hypothetical protein